MVDCGIGSNALPTMEGPLPNREENVCNVFKVENVNARSPSHPVQHLYSGPVVQRQEFRQQQPYDQQKRQPHPQQQQLPAAPAQQQQQPQQQQQQQPLSPQQSHESLNPLDQGYSCVVYDSAQEKGRRFKAYRRVKKKCLDEDDLTAKINNLKLNPEKSPVAKLNEFQNLSKKKIDFELISVDGHVHSPVFTLSAKCDDTIVFGKGSSKKEAKNNAAIAFLNQIDLSNSHNIISSTTSNHSLGSSYVNYPEKVLESITNLNPVGVLQELCMARHWELPSYKPEYTGPQNPCYLTKCSLKIYVTIGKGNTKQLAKRKAARLMYDRIKDLSPKEMSALKTSRSKSNMVENNNVLGNNNLEEQKITNFCDTLQFLRVFFDELKLSNNTTINILKELKLIDPSMINVVEFLENLGQEEGFNVTYVLISTKSSNVEHKVLVQLTINPLIVNIGKGKTFEEAQEAAAYTSLMYLKLLLED